MPLPGSIISFVSVIMYTPKPVKTFEINNNINAVIQGNFLFGNKKSKKVNKNAGCYCHGDLHAYTPTNFFQKHKLHYYEN